MIRNVPLPDPLQNALLLRQKSIASRREILTFLGNFWNTAPQFMEQIFF